VKLFANITEQHGGRVIKTIGDEVMAIFPEAAQAGRAAVDIQLGIAGMAPVEKVRLGVRIGLHYGSVVERDGDVFGDTVNLSARLTEMASRGQIITSLETVGEAGRPAQARLPQALRDSGEGQGKGRADLRDPVDRHGRRDHARLPRATGPNAP
jgi:class 3 adenylate cyclase